MISSLVSIPAAGLTFCEPDPPGACFRRFVAVASASARGGVRGVPV
jgi:hypothetical protein